jgi:hypothetical protein
MNKSEQKNSDSESESNESIPRNDEQPIDTVNSFMKYLNGSVFYCSLESDEIISTHVVLCQIFCNEKLFSLCDCW